MGVTVAICTFRRPSVTKAVKSVARQKLPPNIAMRILVIDNDATPSAKDLIEDLHATSPVKIEYMHVPGQNISVARNAALGAATTRMLAFLDDDEYAAPDWLANLFALSEGAQAVFGPCEATYPDDAPSWMKAGDYHSNRIRRSRRAIDTGYTSNVLIDMEFVRLNGLKFDPALGQTGGEDTMFFHAFHKSGGTLRYAPQAIVHEEVVSSRLNLTWIRLRRYRAGQVYAMMLYRFSRRSYRRAVCTAPVKIFACLFMYGLLIFSPARALWWLMRGFFHLGVLSFGLGAEVHREYRRNA
ncbi:MAG: glycosyltransferase [Hyphomicrobiales bacterium]|nr:glycosyltransferase [Hyphomicrobiales bacterium]